MRSPRRSWARATSSSGRAAASLAALALAACQGGEPRAATRLQPLWTVTGLEDPESVALSADGTFFYVTNVAGEGDAKDGRGFVSRVSRDGRLIEKEWAGGLDGPKGAVLAGGRLFVTDITRLAAIDTATGKLVETHEVPGAGFLNDIAIAPDGLLLASDSARGRIYAKANKGDVVVWAEDPQLRSANGLLPEQDRLVVTTMQGLLLAVDYRTKAITVLARDLGNADGVVRLDDGRYLVGEWPGRLFEVRADGSASTLIDTRAQQTYLNDFLRVGDQLIAPNWKPGALTAYRITP